MSTVIVAVSDLHCNSTIGLCPPRVTLDDGGTYQHNKAQAWTWTKWIDFWEAAKDFVKTRKKKRKFFLVLNGDLVDGDHHDTPQIISRNMADQHRITMQSLKPALDLNPDHIFVIRGTETHTGKSAQWEEFLGADLGAELDPDRDSHSWWTCQIQTDEGVLVDLAHHGAKGRLPWTSVNGAEKIADVIQANHWRRGERPPDIAIRSHVHDLILAGENKQTRVVVLPAWQLSTAFGHRIDPGNLLPVGGVIVDVDKKRWPELEGGRKYKLFPKRYDPPRKKPWQPK